MKTFFFISAENRNRKGDWTMNDFVFFFFFSLFVFNNNNNKNEREPNQFSVSLYLFSLSISPKCAQRTKCSGGVLGSSQLCWRVTKTN